MGAVTVEAAQLGEIHKELSMTSDEEVSTMSDVGMSMMSDLEMSDVGMKAGEESVED